MISRLPRWVWGGAGVLAFIAGMINVVGFLGMEHQGITHLTGTASMFGVALSELRPDRSFHFLGILSAFVAGAVLSGFLLADSTLRLGRRYGAALFLETILLVLAVPLLSSHHLAGDYLASCAAGLQNAMASTYSGSVVRTTHLTGMFTDIGIALGQFFRGIRTDRLRLLLYGIIVGSFIAGGAAGAVIFRHFGYRTLLVPAALTGLAALGYTVYQWRER
ncbi:MAG TPA: YoaK family protein [Chthoniobacteraceae bacterium]|nr:YoaK family protein [Chthoniobacteraceae bacterium]